MIQHGLLDKTVRIFTGGATILYWSSTWWERICRTWNQASFWKDRERWQQSGGPSFSPFILPSSLKVFFSWYSNTIALAVLTLTVLSIMLFISPFSSHMFPVSELDGMKFESLSSLIHCQMILMKPKVSSLTRLSKLTSYPFYNLIHFSVFWHWFDKFSAFFGTSYCCSKIAVRLVWTHATGCNPSGAWDSKGHWWSNAWASRCKYGIDEPFLLPVANTCSSTLSTCIFPFVNVWLCSPPLSWLAETRGLMGKAFIKCISKASQ